jgi:hypothetical protein
MKNVVEESVFFVPQFVGVLAETVHGASNPEEMFDEFHGNGEHVLAKERHPGSAVGLFQEAASR